MYCNCNQEAKLVTVKKEGPNKGRTFYACPKPKGEQCDFFDWASPEPKPKADIILEELRELRKITDLILTGIGGKPYHEPGNDKLNAELDVLATEAKRSNPPF